MSLSPHVINQIRIDQESGHTFHRFDFGFLPHILDIGCVFPSERIHKIDRLVYLDVIVLMLINCDIGTPHI